MGWAPGAKLAASVRGFNNGNPNAKVLTRDEIGFGRPYCQTKWPIQHRQTMVPLMRQMYSVIFNQTDRSLSGFLPLNCSPRLRRLHGKGNVRKSDLTPEAIGSQIGVALPFQKDKEGQLSDRDVVNCHILLIEVANFTNTFSHFTACPYVGTSFFLAENGRLVLNIIHGDDWGGLFESLTSHGFDGSMALLGRVGRGIHQELLILIDANFVGRKKRKSLKITKDIQPLLLIKLVMLLEWLALSAVTLDLWRPSTSPEGSSVSDGNFWSRSVEDKAGIRTLNMMSGQVHISESNWILMAHNIVVLVAEFSMRVYLRNDTLATRGEIACNFIGCVCELVNLHGARCEAENSLGELAFRPARRFVERRSYVDCGV
ncbi:hypothetical protein Nepgr_008735 [Nepenthes gracilis]|uniref:Uncharacterized protein n=1 Tax=Nepenthes gracilis TaxID=150966 RepID=A0AAD3S9M4_NEPGR|nr:hypothetical protein Nepgr_008735 [Nepenthes gracilis]